MLTLADGFTAAEMTDAVNGMPYRPGVIGSLGLFNSRGVATRNVTIDSRDGVLVLVGATEPGSPGQQFRGGKARTFVIRAPRHRLESSVSAASLQDARAFGSDRLAAVNEAIAWEQEQMTASLDLTDEHALLGAIRGEVVDGQTGEVLYNLFDQMGETPRASIDFALDDDTTDLEGIFDQIRLDAIEDGRGMISADVEHEVIYGKNAWAAFKNHAKVRAAWDRFQDGAWLRDRKVGFSIWGANHRQYVGGSGVSLADNEIRVFPRSEGPTSIYQRRYAPADTLDDVNGEGLPRYSWIEQTRRDRVDVILESSPVAFCRVPRVLRAGTA